MKATLNMRKLMKKIFLLLITLMTSQLNAHDGAHGDEDMLVKKFGDLGHVDFSTTCDKNQQASMNTALALYHHMMYKQAEINFKSIIKKQPNCAMAYWGYAMTLFHPLWPDTISNKALLLGEKAINKAQSLSNTSIRENLFINATAHYYKDWKNTNDNDRILAWEQGQKLLYEKFPKDIDAAAIYALSHIATSSMSDKNLTHQKESGAILDHLYEIAPLHPGVVHYSIHAYDSNFLASKAVVAARAYDKIAPDVTHALHMPSHIFVRLGLWNDVANWNIRSAKAALNYPSNGTTSMHYLHAIDYLNYAYLQLKEYDKVQLSIDNLQSHHKYQDVFPAAYALAAIPVRQVLEQKQWLKAKDLTPKQPAYLSWDKYPQVLAITYFAKGLGAARSGKPEIAQQNIEILNKLYEKTLKLSPNYWAKLIDAQRQTIQAWITFSNGDKERAINQLTQAADLEDSLDKNPVTPGAVLPSRELLGDMLVMNNDYTNAIIAYEKTLVINPNRLNSLDGLAFCQGKLSAK